jgi:hypothetical protein
MAPNLEVLQHELIRNMILSKSLKTSQMAEVACCSTRSIKSIRSNLHCFGTTKAPFNDRRRPRSVTPPMLEALREYLLGKPDQYLDEMVAAWPTVHTTERSYESVVKRTANNGPVFNIYIPPDRNTLATTFGGVLTSLKPCHLAALKSPGALNVQAILEGPKTVLCLQQRS